MGTRGAWAKDFAHALGNSQPSEDIIKWISCWTKAEGTAARYNPLATCQAMNGATPFNAPLACVKNYPDRQTGIDATVKTLGYNYDGYAAIRDGILSNDASKAQYGLSIAPWGTNPGTVRGCSVGDVTGELLASEPETEGGTVDNGGGGSGSGWNDTESDSSGTVSTSGSSGSLIDQVMTFNSFVGNVGKSIVAEFGSSAWQWHLAGLIAVTIGAIIVIREFIPVQQVVQAVKVAAA